MPRHPPCALKHLHHNKMLASTMQHSTHNHTPASHDHHHTHTRDALGQSNQGMVTPRSTTRVSSQDPTACQASGYELIRVPPSHPPRKENGIRDKENPNQTTVDGFNPTNTVRLLRKEVIQPHLPVRLPCYDFVPIASPTFDNSLHKG